MKWNDGFGFVSSQWQNNISHKKDSSSWLFSWGVFLPFILPPSLNPNTIHSVTIVHFFCFYHHFIYVWPQFFLIHFYSGVQMYTTLKMGCSKSNWSTSFTFKRGPIIYMAQILRLKMIFFLLFSIETLQSFNFMSFLLVQRYM